MILTVISIDTKEKKDKETVYSVKLRGFNGNLVKATLTLEAEWKQDIERLIPLRTGERRLMELNLLDRTLDEFAEMEEAEDHRAAIEHDKMLEKRRAASQED